MTVIFDLDGTLANSICDLGDSVNSALEKYGLPLHSYDEYRRFVGNGTRLLISRSVPEEVRGTGLESEIFELFSKLYEENCLNKTKPYEHITEALSLLKARGVKLAVASNKPEEFSRKIVSSLFGDDAFACVAGSRDDREKKPAPDIVFDILDKLGESIDSCVIVGDSEVDVATAKNAGACVIGCSWGFRGREVLEKCGCEVIVDSAENLCDEIFKAFEACAGR